MRRTLLRVAKSVLLGGAVCLTAWLVLCVRYLVFPKVDPTERTDAVFILASPGGEAALRGDRDKFDRGGVLVVSTPPVSAQLPVYQAVCRPSSDREVICVPPNPSTTQGEALAISRLARERGWASVTVVTHRSHASRARMLMQRYFPGKVRMSVVDTEYGLSAWTCAFAYETGAYLKATLPQIPARTSPQARPPAPLPPQSKPIFC